VIDVLQMVVMAFTPKKVDFAGCPDEVEATPEQLSEAVFGPSIFSVRFLLPGSGILSLDWWRCQVDD
jgi:hypothetical protein